MNGVTTNGYLRGDLQLSFTPFVASDPTGGVTGAVGQFETPFAMSGVLTLFEQPFGLQPLLTQDITTTGIASFDAKNIGGGGFVAGFEGPGVGLRLTFGPVSNPPPTPEPASLLLIATGVAPLVMRRRRHE